MQLTTAHAVLRDRRHWEGAVKALTPDADGMLSLARVPAPADGRPIERPTIYPYPREVSGLSLGPCDALFIADTAHDRVLYIDGTCGSRTYLPPNAVASDLPGHFRAPRGLAFGQLGLAVADSGNARLQWLAAPWLEPSAAFFTGPRPVSVAIDHAGRQCVIDATTHRLQRVQADGTPDLTFNQNVLAQLVLQRPLFLAVAGEKVFVADEGTNEVHVFSDAGVAEATLPGPSGWLPGAIAASTTRIYVADAATGTIRVFEHLDSAISLLGEVQGYRGPVTALALNAAGDLYVKPALDDGFYLLPADTAYLSSGELVAGPFDAGVECEWERVWVDAQVPPGAAVQLSVVVKSSLAPPSPGDWLAQIGSDVLLAQQTHDNRRYVWMRVTLLAGANVSPQLIQVRAATAAENWLDYLPMTYGHHDEKATGFLSRWLKLLRGEFARVEETLDDLPRLADADFLRASDLPWLASWLALELPHIATAEERRALIKRAAALLARRGTPQSIAEFVELHTGIRPAIYESFNDRRIWVLGEGSRLGFDTRLPAVDPHGMVVPEIPTVDGGTPIGRAIVGESGSLATHQIGLPLFAEEAYRFCVVVDGYRARDPATRREIARIVDREKPAHTDYRIEYLEPDARVGLQMRVGVDIIVGGDPPPLTLGAARLGAESNLPPADTARVGQALLDGALILN